MVLFREAVARSDLAAATWEWRECFGLKRFGPRFNRLRFVCGFESSKGYPQKDTGLVISKVVLRKPREPPPKGASTDRIIGSALSVWGGRLGTQISPPNVSTFLLGEQVTLPRDHMFFKVPFLKVGLKSKGKPKRQATLI